MLVTRPERGRSEKDHPGKYPFHHFIEPVESRDREIAHEHIPSQQQQQEAEAANADQAQGGDQPAIKGGQGPLRAPPCFN